MVGKELVFWDVDTQYDFMMPQGSLYIPGADAIIENVSRARKLALEKGYSIIASTDWHRLDDDEISLEPDNKNTFAPHCLASEPGAKRVGYLGTVRIETVGIEEESGQLLARLVGKKQFHLEIRKNTVDVFSNPNTIKLLKLIQPKKIIVFGVALDVCVYMTVRGLLNWGGAEIVVLKDAVKELGIKSREQVFAFFREKGVLLTELDELARQL